MDPKTVDQLVELLRVKGGRAEIVSVWELVFALLLAFLLSVLIARVYRFTHRTSGYSQSFAQTLVLVSLVTTLIMVVVGSNIARAFSLLGALSIIRFRNAVKETRDVGFIFFAMAIAMACGTRFWQFATVATLMVSGVMILFHLLDFGASKRPPEYLLRLYLDPEVELEARLGDTLRQLFSDYALVRMESARQGLEQRAYLSVTPAPEQGPEQVVRTLGAVDGVLRVSYDLQQHEEDA